MTIPIFHAILTALIAFGISVLASLIARDVPAPKITSAAQRHAWVGLWTVVALTLVGGSVLLSSQPTATLSQPKRTATSSRPTATESPNSSRVGEPTTYQTRREGFRCMVVRTGISSDELRI